VRAGGRERGRPAGRGGVSRDKRFSPSTPGSPPRGLCAVGWLGGAVRGQDPPDVCFATHSKKPEIADPLCSSNRTSSASSANDDSDLRKTDAERFGELASEGSGLDMKARSVMTAVMTARGHHSSVPRPIAMVQSEADHRSKRERQSGNKDVCRIWTIGWLRRPGASPPSRSKSCLRAGSHGFIGPKGRHDNPER
jgi:hypothetical protein